MMPPLDLIARAKAANWLDVREVRFFGGGVLWAGIPPIPGRNLSGPGAYGIKHVPLSILDNPEAGRAT